MAPYVSPHNSHYRVLYNIFLGGLGIRKPLHIDSQTSSKSKYSKPSIICEHAVVPCKEAFSYV